MSNESGKYYYRDRKGSLSKICQIRLCRIGSKRCNHCVFCEGFSADYVACEKIFDALHGVKSESILLKEFCEFGMLTDVRLYRIGMRCIASCYQNSLPEIIGIFKKVILETPISAKDLIHYFLEVSKCLIDDYRNINDHISHISILSCRGYDVGTIVSRMVKKMYLIELMTRPPSFNYLEEKPFPELNIESSFFSGFTEFLDVNKMALDVTSFFVLPVVRVLATVYYKAKGMLK